MKYIRQYSCGYFIILLLISCLCACGTKHELEKLEKLAQATSAIPRSMRLIDDGGFISETPCGPPCFMGITPGVSTQNDVYDALPKNGIDIKKCLMDNTHDAGANRESGSNVGEGLGCDSIGISFSPTDTVTSIIFKPDKVITLADVIKKHGEPDAIQVEQIGVHVISTFVYIFYDEIHTVLSFYSPAENPHITADSIISQIWYDDEKEYRDFRKRSQSWLGYGEY